MSNACMFACIQGHRIPIHYHTVHSSKRNGITQLTCNMGVVWIFVQNKIMISGYKIANKYADSKEIHFSPTKYPFYSSIFCWTQA